MKSGIFGLVPDWNYECRNADADVSLLDADAQLGILGLCIDPWLFPLFSYSKLHPHCHILCETKVEKLW